MSLLFFSSASRASDRGTGRSFRSAAIWETVALAREIGEVENAREEEGTSRERKRVGVSRGMVEVWYN